MIDQKPFAHFAQVWSRVTASAPPKATEAAPLFPRRKKPSRACCYAAPCGQESISACPD